MRVFFDGTLSEPRLDHPEGVAVAGDGAVWCGGERGQIYRIEPDGSAIECVASTDGFCLGMTFGPDGALYVCDLVHRAVFRLAPGSDRPERFAEGFAIPNVPAFAPDGRLFVTDSHDPHEPGPGIWCVDGDGTTRLWDDEPLSFANGIAFSGSGDTVYVVETHARRVSAIGLRPDGTPGPREVLVSLPGRVPDGLTRGPDSCLYVACYEPSVILRVDDGGTVSVFAADPDATTLCHPTNVAFRGRTMFAANLGRWHITEVGDV